MQARRFAAVDVGALDLVRPGQGFLLRKDQPIEYPVPSQTAEPKRAWLRIDRAKAVHRRVLGVERRSSGSHVRTETSPTNSEPCNTTEAMKATKMPITCSTVRNLRFGALVVRHRCGCLHIPRSVRGARVVDRDGPQRCKVLAAETNRHDATRDAATAALQGAIRGLPASTAHE